MDKLHDSIRDLVVSTDLLRHSIDELTETFKEIQRTKELKKQIFEAIGADEISALF
jgi:hypothetical protein